MIRPAKRLVTSMLLCLFISLFTGHVYGAVNISDLKSPDNQVRLRASEQLRADVKSNAREASAWIVNNRVFNILLDADEAQLVSELALVSANAQLDRIDRLDYCLTNLVKALLRLNRNGEALMRARSLYNVCSIAGTGAAIGVVYDALLIVDPTNARRFKLQQAASAQEPNALERVHLGTNLLDSLELYQEGFESVESTKLRRGPWKRLAEANLALITGRTADARAVISELELSTNAAVHQAGIELAARCIKAEGGGLYTANAYLLSAKF